MASSSSAPPQEPRPYEVFLSFRGEDTRNNFVSHLHSALVRRGIITYYDDHNLRYGQNLPIELVKAIQESAIAIVVLSKNYASSTWCLRELVKIVECKNKGKLEIYPIFYHVEPTDVRHQTKSFLKAFKDHVVKFKDNMEMVNAWRKSLTEVSNLKGADARKKDEASLINEIADEILWKLPMEASSFTESLVGMESRISYLKVLINKNPDEVRFIGFWGMGGVGKTTTARAIFDDCESEFEGSCFLGDVTRHKNKMVKLQQQLLSEVLKSKIERIHNVIQGSSMIRKRMCHKRVLLVVDNVDDIEQLNILVGQYSWFGKGSRIIITTRDKQLLKDVHDTLFVDTLNVKEALLLFRDHAFKNEHPKENYMKLSHQVLRYAGGLPLALEVLGDHLYKRKESIWLDTLRRLKEVPEKKVISILQISFDEGLNRLQQDIFLYIACFFRGENRDTVMECLRVLHLYPEEGIPVLIQKSLIHESQSRMDTDKSLEMHDLLQDMGHYIVRQRADKEVRRYSHLWLEDDIKRVLLAYEGFAEAEGIVIDLKFYKDAIKSHLLKESSFRRMEKLRFLKIRATGINQANFFQSYVRLPYGLRWLYWEEYPGKCLGRGFHPKELVHLEMPYSLIERTPDLDHMPNLEVLDLSYSTKLVRVHGSLALHRKIRRINLKGCAKIKYEFPALFWTDSLEYLNLSMTGLQMFPQMCRNVDSLKEVYFAKTFIRGLPISIRNATGLRNLKLGWKDSVTIELGSLSSFKHLHYFRIEYFARLTTVPQLPSSLQILKILGCNSLTEYPNTVPSQLKTLKITDSKIKTTPDFNQLPNLLELDLSGSDQLSEVDASLGAHEKIERIDLSDCRNLKVFPTIVKMGRLVTLCLSSTRLKRFPEITGNVYNLANLNLASSHIRTLPESIGHATGLKTLNLTGCRFLVSLPISLQPLEKLQILFGDHELSLVEQMRRSRYKSNHNVQRIVVSNTLLKKKLSRLTISSEFHLQPELYHCSLAHVDIVTHLGSKLQSLRSGNEGIIGRVSDSIAKLTESHGLLKQ